MLAYSLGDFGKIAAKAFCALALSLMSASAWGQDVFEALRSCCGEREDGLVTRLPVHDVPEFEMVVVSDFQSANTALNPNVSWDKVDLDATRKTAYVETADGKRGLKLEFERAGFNRLRRGDKVKLNLNGCKVRMDVATGALTVTNVSPLNVVSRTSGDAQAIPEKRKHISELDDNDIYTLVTLLDVELIFKEGAIINIDERYGQYVPSLHSGIRGEMRSYADGAVTLLRDPSGAGIPMAVNTLCDWRKQAAPRGSGTVTGILVMERNRRYGDAAAHLYIRPLSKDDVRLSDKSKTSSWKTWLGWFPGRMPGDKFDFEKAGYSAKGVDDRLLNNVGPKAWLSTDSGERRIQKASSYNSLKSENGTESGGSIKMYGTISDWYNWNSDGSVASGKSVCVECSPAKLKATQLQFSFEISAGDGNILNTRGIPTRWIVEYSLDGVTWHGLEEIDGERSFGLRPMPSDSKTEKKTGRVYHMMYDCGIGMQQHSYNLPSSVIGAEKLDIRISPSVGRWWHLSTNPARDTEYPDAKTNLVKRGNKQYSTIRLGSVFFDYK